MKNLGEKKAWAFPGTAQFLPRDASAERGYEIASRLSVCLSVCP